MWPFKQETPKANPYEEHLERVREWFGPHLSEEELLNPARTADGHRLDELVVCFDCGQLVLKGKAKAVEYQYEVPSYWQGMWRKLGATKTVRHYCPTHAPGWDAVRESFLVDQGRPHYYRRILTVPERLEEIVETPKPVRVARKRKTGKGTG